MTVSRLQLLIPLLLWALWLGHRQAVPLRMEMGAAIYLMSLALVVMFMRRWARRAMRGTTFHSVQATSRFHQGMFLARWCIMLIHAAALFYSGWGDLILASGVDFHGRFESIAALVSMLPVVLAWIGLIWAQYPLDRAIREQNAMMALNLGDAIFEPPPMSAHIVSQTRLQVLSLLAPVGLAIVLRDLLMLTMQFLHWPRDSTTELFGTLFGAAFVFLIGPEVLRLVLPVTPMPDSPLRERLEQMCKRLGLRYRNILIWRTHFSFGNAAVMGLIPQFRYILLSDLLIETMNDRQIEAVFAHEAGHVMHRHMTWYVVFAIVFFSWLDASGTVLGWAIWGGSIPVYIPLDTILTVVGIIGFFVIFGSLSRSFERQADLFAARSLTGGQEDSQVQSEGVEVFNSALAHVARLNNMPMDANQMFGGQNRLLRAYIRIVHHAGTWLHGSIRSRMEYLRKLPDSPDLTARFDRRMTAIRIGLLVALCSTTAWIITSMTR